MLSIEEIKLLIEKLEKAKESDLKQLIETNLKILNVPRFLFECSAKPAGNVNSDLAIPFPPV